MENKDQHQTGFKPTTPGPLAGSLTAVPQSLPPSSTQTKIAAHFYLKQLQLVSFLDQVKKARKQKLVEFN